MLGERSLSTLHRTDIISRMTHHQFDLLVIGGGITGAGIALDAASRGLDVALVEKQDFAEGTSSRSTKLIHGGLRYLKQGEIRLVREVGHERAILHRNAPHLVHAERMLLPIVRGGTYGKWATSVGLWLYDCLAGVKHAERRRMLNATQTVVSEPLLNPEGLRGGGLYYEYRTDDARLTMEVVKTAASHGATCLNYVEATEFHYESGTVVGARVRDCLTQQEFSVRARKVVNATGPWVDGLRNRDHSRTGKQLHLTKGVHLVVPHVRLPIRQSIYFDTSDGRMIFTIPRGKTTYIGTTDTDYQGRPEDVAVTPEDVAYLLHAVNHMFPTVALKMGDILSSWAGLRPLIHEEGKSPSELSRKDEVFLSPTGLISIAGGKLTGYRKMAERVVDLVFRQLQRNEGLAFVPCRTEHLVLSGGEPMDSDAWREQKERVMALGTPGPVQHGIADAAEGLYEKYGSNARVVLEIAKNLADQGIPADEKLIPRAEVQYTVEQEMVVHLSDFFVRRTGRLWFENEQLASLLPAVSTFMGSLLDWSGDEMEEEIRAWQRTARETRAFTNEKHDEAPAAIGHATGQQ